jgi:RND family efflux transporter MFP subunit
MIKRFICAVLLLGSLLNAQQIYATFDVTADKSAKLAFNASGIVDTVSVDIGSVVKKGDILATLDNAETKALLNVYKTTLKFTEKDYERQIKIRNIIDQEKFDSYAKAYESAKAQVAYQQTLVDKTILKAPFEGIIISKDIERGDVVSAQAVKTVFKIQSRNKRKLILWFDQKYHKEVKVGDLYRYKLDGDEKEYEGMISKVYPYADTKSRKIGAEVETSGILTGLFGEGYIYTKQKGTDE